MSRLSILAIVALSPLCLVAESVSPAPAPEAAARPPVAEAAPVAVAPLTLDEVLAGVTTHYPPFLAALIEQDIVNGRTRQAQGAFDTTLSVGVTGQPDGYYDGTYGRAIVEQPLSFWGGSVYAGYRLSSGYLPNYNKERTPDSGQFVVGIKVPLLRDGTIDSRRVRLRQAELDRQLADPYILRQRLDFVRAATIAYYNWVALGHRYRLAEELLRVADRRRAAINEMIAAGAGAEIARVDNERLILSRRIALTQAKRRFEGAAIELSLFHRSPKDAEPILCDLSRLPAELPPVVTPGAERLPAEIERAVRSRPEMRRYELTLEKNRLDLELADNAMLPDLSVGVQAYQSVDGKRLYDVEQTEVTAGVELKIPLDRREAKGRLEVARAQRIRLEYEMRFARERIVADVRDSYSALRAAAEQIAETGLNVELAGKLRDAEEEKFRLGASDMLALQIREQTAFDARVQDIEARAEYFRALANFRAAAAADAPEKFADIADAHDFRPAN